MKATPKKKKEKKVTLSSLKTDLWKEFSKFIRLRDAVLWAQEHPEYNGEPMCGCITCRRTIKAFGQGGAQAGHFIPGRHNAYLFDEDQVNAQCYHCNIGLKGNWPEYLEVMVKRHGQERVDAMIYEQRNEMRKFTIPELEEMLALYKGKIKELELSS